TWDATTANCDAPSHRNRSSRRTLRSGDASTRSATLQNQRHQAATRRPVSPQPAAVNYRNSKKETFVVPQQMIWFFVSIAFTFIAWGIVSARSIWPPLRLRQRAEALRPLLILHSFRFIGLSMLVPGVVSPDLPPAFAHAAIWRHHCGDTC